MSSSSRRRSSSASTLRRSARTAAESATVVDDTLKALELGACETLIVYENLDITRWVLKASDGS